MNKNYYHDCYFFFVSKRRPNAFCQFRGEFGLTLLSTPEVFEVLDYDTGDVVHEAENYEELLHYLDDNPNSSFDFYLGNADSDSFMFCYRPVAYHVMGIPYGYLERERLLKLLNSFEAICGWGWHDAMPAETFDEMYAAANATHSAFVRYANNRLLEQNEY